MSFRLNAGPAAQFGRCRLRPSFCNQQFRVSWAERQAIAYLVAAETDSIDCVRELPREHNRLDALIRCVARPPFPAFECALSTKPANSRRHDNDECNAGAPLRTEGWITAATAASSAVIRAASIALDATDAARGRYWQLVDTIFTESTFSLAAAALDAPAAPAPAAGDADSSSIVPVTSTLCPT